MLSFCPDCGSMLQIEEGRECMRFSCPCCPYVLPITKPVSSKFYPKPKDLDEVLGGPGAWASAQVTDDQIRRRACHNFLSLRQHRLRSSLEGMMLFLFLQVVIFAVPWLFIFAGLFHIVRRYCYQSGRFDQQISTFLGYAAVSTVFYELIHLAHKYRAEDECNYFVRLASRTLPFLFECNTLSGSFLWRLNPVSVLANLFRDLCVLLAATLGSSFGTLVSSFFDKLSWLVFIPAIILTIFIVLFSTMAIFRYEISIFGFLSIRPSSIPIQKPPIKPSTPPPLYCQSHDPSSRPVKMIREIYQRLAP